MDTNTNDNFTDNEVKNENTEVKKEEVRKIDREEDLACKSVVSKLNNESITRNFFTTLVSLGLTAVISVCLFTSNMFPVGFNIGGLVSICAGVIFFLCSAVPNIIDQIKYGKKYKDVEGIERVFKPTAIAISIMSGVLVFIGLVAILV